MVLVYFKTISFGFNGTTTMAHDSEYLKKDHVFFSIQSMRSLSEHHTVVQ